MVILDKHKDFDAAALELKHYLDYPECGRGRSYYRDRLPLRDEEVKKDPDVLKLPEALGLELIEVLSALWVFIFGTGFFFAVLVFAISYWAIYKDIQGAFAAGGFLASFLAVVSMGITAVVSFK